jgi:DNA-binding response OmpR family regulator
MGAGYDATGDALLAVRVLVAEHQAVIAMDLMQMLGALGCIALGPVWPCEVVVAASRLHPDAVLLGLDVLEDLAFPTVRDLAERGIPVVLMTGRRQHRFGKSLLRSAAFLHTPFQVADFRRALAPLLR